MQGKGIPIRILDSSRLFIATESELLVWHLA